MAPPSRKPLLARELITEMWSALGARLREGEAISANAQFRVVLGEIYQDITGQPASEAVRDEIARMVQSVNRDHPETYLAQGVQNAIGRAFEEGARRHNWDLATIQSKGARALRRFSQQEAVRDLLEDINLSTSQLSVADCLVGVVSRVASGGDMGVDRTHARRPSTFRPELAAAPPEAAPAEAAPSKAGAEGVDADTEAAIAAGDVDVEVARERSREGERRRTMLEAEEYEKVPQRLDVYVDQGVVDEQEAEQLRKLHDVDRRLHSGEIDEAEASEIRNSILSGKARDHLERRVREAVASSVRYLQVFEAMKRIDPRRHDALGFLIQHKDLVVSGDESVDMGPAMKALMEDVDLLEDVIALMERKDQELRMMSVRLHPYGAIMSRGVERIGNMTIDESFLDDLENLEVDAMSERLHSEDGQTRVRPAADMRCLISLVDHVTKRTRFRKELRLLRIAKQLEEFYQGTSDMKEARHQAESFLNRRLRRMFPDMDANEAAEIKQRSTRMMDQIESRILDERKAEVGAKRADAGKAAASAAADGGEDGAEDGMELSEEEIQKGVQIGRVEMRVAGSTRRIPTKIMPDPDDPEVTVIASKDPETGELVPARRRGAKRLVERTRDGYWAEAR